MDADGDAVVWLVAANLTDELQDGVDGQGDVVVWPVFIVELVDRADFLQEKSTGRVWVWPAQPEDTGVLRPPPDPICIGRLRLGCSLQLFLLQEKCCHFMTCPMLPVGFTYPGSDLP